MGKNMINYIKLQYIFLNVLWTTFQNEIYPQFFFNVSKIKILNLLIAILLFSTLEFCLCK
jgi:hypothetical protein